MSSVETEVNVRTLANWYVTYLSKKGSDILKRSGLTEQTITEMVEFMEANPNIKKFAEAISNHYNTTLRERYESHYKDVTGRNFGDGIYAPADKVTPDDGLIKFQDGDIKNNLSKNLEEKDLETATIDLNDGILSHLNRYTRSMNKSMVLSPIALEYQKLFGLKNKDSLGNYFKAKIGDSAFTKMQEEAERFFNGSPLLSDSVINQAIGFYAQANIGGRIKSTFQQFGSFSHWWGAGLEYNLPMFSMTKQIPFVKAKTGLYSEEEMEMFNTLVAGDYIRLRAKTGGYDIEMQRILKEIDVYKSKALNLTDAMKDKGSDIYRTYTALNNLFVKLGDKGAIIYGPVGGVSFGMALYCQLLSCT